MNNPPAFAPFALEPDMAESEEEASKAVNPATGQHSPMTLCQSAYSAIHP